MQLLWKHPFPWYLYKMVTQKLVRTWGAISYIWSDKGIWLDREQSQIGFFISDKIYFFPMRAHHALSCHLIWVPWSLQRNCVVSSQIYRFSVRLEKLLSSRLDRLSKSISNLSAKKLKKYNFESFPGVLERIRIRKNLNGSDPDLGLNTYIYANADSKTV